jgi:hypothetical protein
MYTFEEHDYEAERVLNSLTQYTKSGNATWRITDYNPIGCLPADIVENKKDSPSLVCHTISAIGITPEGSWNVHIMESIYLSSGKGDIDITLSDDFTDSLLSLDGSDEYADCTADNIATHFKDSPVLTFAQVVLPVLMEAAAPIFNSYTWYDFEGCVIIPPSDRRTMVFRLTKRLAKGRRIADFHKMVFDMNFREQLKKELL